MNPYTGAEGIWLSSRQGGRPKERPQVNAQKPARPPMKPRSVPRRPSHTAPAPNPPISRHSADDDYMKRGDSRDVSGRQLMVELNKLIIHYYFFQCS